MFPPTPQPPYPTKLSLAVVPDPTLERDDSTPSQAKSNQEIG
jgi:hypothetical protein